MPSRRNLEVLVKAGYANRWDLDSPDRPAAGNQDIREELLRLIVAWECSWICDAAGNSRFSIRSE